MKKLIIAAAAVGLTVVAQAASIQWSTPVKSFTLQDGSKPEGATVYLVYTGASDYSAMIESIAAGNAFDSTAWDAVMGSATSYVVPAQFAAMHDQMLNNNYGQVALNSVDAGNSPTGSYSDFAFMVFDSNESGDYYAVSATKQGMPYVGDDPSVGSAVGFTSSSFTDTANGATGWVKIETVPEPTSGLLLLLGVAGLALKRRRA